MKGFNQTRFNCLVMLFILATVAYMFVDTVYAHEHDRYKAFAKTAIKAIKERRIVPNKKNRVYLLGGYGATGGLNQNDNRVYPDEGFVGGIGYQRKLNQDINVGIQVQSNDTTSLSVGYDF